MSEQVELIHELGQNFIDYAMAVNTDRSLPDARTGLKPVHRRILYDSLVNGHVSTKKYVKSANIVGETMAEYHPHGDSSIYDALVRLARPWIMRYPLIDFHGNYGNIAGDPPAAYRYTECRLAKISEEGLLSGIRKDVVDFIPNYSESTTEPTTLPSYFPNLLCNPNSGIGVAMACSWLPHNLREVEIAILAYLNGEEPTLPGPDFPTGGLIINKDSLPGIIAKGHGTVKLRGQYRVEGNNIVFYEIPYGINTEALIEQINDAAEKEPIDSIIEARDESNNKNGMRITIELAKDADVSVVVAKLFNATDLQTSISYNQTALVDKEPKEIGLKECIKIYVDHNMSCIAREAAYDKIKVEQRMHILEGLLKALEDIDNIIALIKQSANTAAAKANLIEKYKFSEEQAKAIVDMKLGKLANLGKIELQEEYAELKAELEHLMALINDEEARKQELKKRLHAIVIQFGDDRKTELQQIDIPKERKEKPEIIPEDCVVVVTETGLVKRIPAKSFKAQKRATTGIKTGDDITQFTTKTNTVDTLMVFSNNGKMYRLCIGDLPEGTNLSRGTSLRELTKMSDNERPMAYSSLTNGSSAEYLFFATANGLVKKVPMSEYDSLKRTGVLTIKLKDGDRLSAVTFVKQEQHMMLITKKGMTIRFKIADLPTSSRIAQGVKGIALNEDDYVIAALPISNDNAYLALVSEGGLGKKVELKEFNFQNRGGKGVSCYKGDLGGAEIVEETDNVLISGNKNNIVLAVKDFPTLSRISLGNIMLKNNSITSVIKI